MSKILKKNQICLFNIKECGSDPCYIYIEVGVRKIQCAFTLFFTFPFLNATLKKFESAVMLLLVAQRAHEFGVLTQ